jgi:hypothetical protein
MPIFTEIGQGMVRRPAHFAYPGAGRASTELEPGLASHLRGGLVTSQGGAGRCQHGLAFDVIRRVMAKANWLARLVAAAESLPESR